MKPVAQAHLPVTAVTHPGMKGKNNEDRYAVTAYEADAAGPSGSNAQLPVLLAVVADGIGGHRAGEIAAGIAVDAICQFMVASGATFASQPGVETLVQAIQYANQLVFQQAQHNPQWTGMGTTCACGWIVGDRLVTASVGDSRIYLVREGRIIQLTTDHTWVQEAIENGLLTEEQAAQHPNIHVIRRYLGSKDTVEPELRLHLAESAKKSAETTEPGIKLLPGDRLIVCTDGLTDLVKDQEILSTLAGQTMNQALGQLVNLANQRGGHDNITIIAIQVPGNGEAAASAGLPARRSKVLAGCLGAVAALIFALLMITGVLWWGTRSGDLSTSTSTLAAPAQTPPGVVPSAIPSVFPETPSVAPTPTYMPIMLETMTGPPGSTLTPWPTNTAYP